MITELSPLQVALEQVRENPNYKKNGFHIDIRDNGTIVLKTFPSEGMFAGKISKDNSDQILTLLKIILEDGNE